MENTGCALLATLPTGKVAKRAHPKTEQRNPLSLTTAPKTKTFYDYMKNLAMTMLTRRLLPQKCRCHGSKVRRESTSGMQKGLIGPGACLIPRKHIGEFLLKGANLLLTNHFVRHLGIFPDEKDMQGRDLGILRHKIAGNRPLTITQICGNLKDDYLTDCAKACS
jgi:hypothetical protein